MRKLSAAHGVAALGVGLLFAACADDTASPGSDHDASNGGSAGHATGGAATGGSGGSRTGSGGTVAENDAGPDASEPSPDASTEVDGSTDGSVEAGIRCFATTGSSGGTHRWQRRYASAFADHVVSDSTGAAIVNGSFTGSLEVGETTLTSNGSSDVHIERILPTGVVDWAKSYGGSAEDYALNLVIDPADRIYLSGLYSGAGNAGGAAFPTFAGTAGRYDAFLASYDTLGVHRWSVAFASTGESDVGNGLAVDGTGSLFVTGRFWNGVNLGGTSYLSAGGSDVYFARLDEPDGAVSATVKFGGTASEGAGVSAWDGEHVWTAYDFVGALVIPMFGTVTSAGGRDLVVIEMDRAGNVLHAERYGGPGDESVIDGVWTGTQFVLTGQTNSATVAFRTGEALTTAGANDVFVMAVDPSLSVAWAKVFGGTGEDRPREVTAGPCGELAITGEFRESMLVGTQTLTATPAAGGGPTPIDAFVIKATADFTPAWARSFGGPLPDRGLGVAFDREGGVFVTVAFQSAAVDFGGGAIAPGGEWGSAVVSLAP